MNVTRKAPYASQCGTKLQTLEEGHPLEIDSETLGTIQDAHHNGGTDEPKAETQEEEAHSQPQIATFAQRVSGFISGHIILTILAILVVVARIVGRLSKPPNETIRFGNSSASVKSEGNKTEFKDVIVNKTVNACSEYNNIDYTIGSIFVKGDDALSLVIDVAEAESGSVSPLLAYAARHIGIGASESISSSFQGHLKKIGYMLQ